MELFVTVKLAAMLPVPDRENGGGIVAVKARVQSGRPQRQSASENIIL